MQEKKKSVALTDEEQIRQLYQDMYAAMIAKDRGELERIHDETYLLIHMTGMRQSREEYIDSILDGTLNYYSKDDVKIDVSVSGGEAKLTGKSRVTAAVFGGACLAGVLISAGFASDWGNLAIKRTADSFPRELLRGISLSGGTAVFASLCGGGAKACAARYFAGKAVLSTAVILTSVLVAGGVMELAQFPAITAAQLSQPFSSQRIDSLFLMAFSACAVFGGAALAAPAAELLGKVFPKFRRFRGLAVLAAMLLAGVAFRFAEGAGELFALGVPMLVFAAGALSERRAEA